MVVGGPFGGALQLLQQWGLYDVILPFILIFAVLYAILQQTKIFNEPKLKQDGTPELDAGKPVMGPNKKVNLIISLAISLMIVIPHVTGGFYSSNVDPINILNSLLPSTMAIVVAVLVFLILAGVVGGGTEAGVTTVIVIVAILAVVGFIAALTTSVFPYGLPSWLSFMTDPSMQALLLVLLIGGIIIWYIQSDSTQPSDVSGFLKGLFKKGSWK